MNRFLNRKKDYSDIKSRAPSQEYSEGWDRIFGNNKNKNKETDIAVHQTGTEGHNDPVDGGGA